MAGAEVIDTELDWNNDDCLSDPYAGIGLSTLIIEVQEFQVHPVEPGMLFQEDYM